VAKGSVSRPPSSTSGIPKAYPILAWSWRPVEFPKGSDERQSKTNDIAVSVYAVFPKNAWSVKVAQVHLERGGARGHALSSSAGLTKVLVVRSGVEGKGSGRRERVNVFEDYQKFFEESDTPRLSGIAPCSPIPTITNSVAQGDYGKFRVCKP
jgi:hypothetical protein